MSTEQTSNLLRLAQEVQQLTTLIVNDLTAANVSEPSFKTTSEPIPETPEHISLRARLNDSAKDLLRLVNGPRNDARTFVCYLYDLAAWQVACEFNFFEAVPEDGVAHVKEIAEKSGVDEDRVGRFMRMLATDRVFEEVDKDVFQHTARSVLYLKDKQWRDVMHYQLDEFFAAASETSASIKQSPSEINGSKNAFVTRHGTTLFDFYKQDPIRSNRFASAMAGVSRLERHFENLKDSYPWDKLGGGKVVDVGGGSGHMSVALARAFPKLEFVVQDSLSMLASASQNDFADMNGRVTFMPHDFFTPQPVSGAGAYLLRYITHNWSDKDCIRIFKALVPGLEKSSPGTPLLINDAVLPALGTSSKYHENRMRQVDIMMMLVLGAKQRTEKEFERLLVEADPRFKIKTIHGKGDMCLVEAYLDVQGDVACTTGERKEIRAHL
ncbi:sterigmatocystin 8-O-methyltransferase precursor [Dothidotthia symphoricarpi CBS 119687]|uniref:Sterigmatocystin 8-O-methyltransferase n=1 Tax=Dothidotthia symphoricarpi CBS 119687 TaxID=1392245 RepID=A0A6A5ZW47_9PLEO|nr:sterigmatocystin 8-O-methyltransferase precursor [Dothidotthia symphoricarpi CBS 119687]KAF2123516.1 sterigmatocystin 8-O-methyltransferase precursor [Dothidotthia symphoricarpi CBS 119687]